MRRRATRGPLTSVADARERAERRLPSFVSQALVGGSGAGTLLRRTVSDFEAMRLVARVGDAPATPDMGARVMGIDISMPIVLAPVSTHAVRPSAEIAAARAAARAGVAVALSNFASTSAQAVVGANAKTFAQIYWAGSRTEIAERVARLRMARAAGLILTVDWSWNPGRDWGGPEIPERVNAVTCLRYAPRALRRPGWLAAYLRAMTLPDLVTPNFATTARPRPTFREAGATWAATPPPTWNDVAWLAREWGGPFAVKGILHAEDAKRAVAAGAHAVVVSNHGGNDLDDAVTSARALASVSAAVGGDVDVLVDSGVRRGSDVVKARALGATAVLVGRPYVWALAARGEAGVSEILHVLGAGTAQALRAVGVQSIDDIRRDHLFHPWGTTPSPESASAEVQG